MTWKVVYKKAIQDDGTLLFPQRLSREFLEQARRTMGSYLFANQYQNEIIPDDERRFKTEWLRPISQIPENTYRFAFVDPAIGQRNHNDYTGIAIVDVDHGGNWYLHVAQRYRLTPSQIISKLFDIQEQFHCQAIGLEIVAYQEALLYMLQEESLRRQVVLPVKGIRRMAVSKETRILGLVPRFEWARIFVTPGMTDFEDEILSFPRGSHDDILDAVASLEELVFYPEKEKEKALERPENPQHPDYEKWFIANAHKRQSQEGDDPHY